LPYPSASNLKRYSEVRQNYSVAVADLQKKLAAYEPPLENPPPTPLQFQDRLRRVVDDVIKSAQQANVGLPENFYLGFEQYRGAPPDTAATPALSAELDAIRDLIDILIKQRVEKITAVKRAPLAHETGGAAATADAARLARTNGPHAASGTDLVTRNPVEIEFTSLPSAFRETLNRISSAPRLYVVAALRVRNEVDKGPSRSGEPAVTGPGDAGRNAPQPPSGPPQLDQNGVPIQPLPEKTPPPLRYVVGLEKVSVAARIDLVRVAPPPH
jgi:hypothetical protein